MKSIKEIDDGHLLMSEDVGDLLGVGGVRVRQMADKGELECTRTPKGVRIFLRSQVEKVKKVRAGR